jgi:small multidrug resistance pump
MSSVLVGLVMVGVAAVAVVGDWFLKLASQNPTPYGNRWFVGGCIIYSLCAFGWVFVMQHLKLATIGVVYSISTILMLTALGVFVFDETLTKSEWAGIACAVLSIVLLARHGG